jgi:accessory gene regulator protein AgrB
MNERNSSMNVKRACSNLSNLQFQGSRDITGLKKLAQELLLKQRIESKEFSGKMVVYSLVFIAVSAIVPAMFQSFVLIGSYFMNISFTPVQIFFISVALFPMLDLGVLILIDSKTPLFLKG